MGSPTVYFYPDASGSLQKLAFPAALTTLQVVTPDEAAEAVTAGGSAVTYYIGPREQVRIVLERYGALGTTQMEREMVLLENHLRRGGRIGFAADASRAWAGLAMASVARGDTSIQTGGNGYSAWEPLATLSAGDVVIIESAAPDYRRECQQISGYSATGTVTCAVDATYAGAPIVRHRDFWPVLRLAASERRPIVTHDGRRTWTVDMTLEYAVEEHAALWAAAATPSLLGGGGVTLEPGSVSGPLALADETAPANSTLWTLDSVLVSRRSGRWRWQQPGIGRLGGG